MKFYCFACGAPNNHLGIKPKKCHQCGADFATEAKKILTSPIIKNDDYITADNLDDSESYPNIEEPEPISQEEIERIFLADAHKSINLRDLMAEGNRKRSQKIKQRKRKK